MAMARFRSVYVMDINIVIQLGEENDHILSMQLRLELISVNYTHENYLIHVKIYELQS